jgi:hypothetical protein
VSRGLGDVYKRQVFFCHAMREKRSTLPWPPTPIA